jgi:hypothetical protein
MNYCCICWFSSIFLLGILIFKKLIARRRYKSFGVKGLRNTWAMRYLTHTNESPSFHVTIFLQISIIGPTRRTIFFHFISVNSLYMFRALFCSSTGGTVCTAIGIILCIMSAGSSSTPNPLAASWHNTHKIIPIAAHTVPPDDEQKSPRNM